MLTIHRPAGGVAVAEGGPREPGYAVVVRGDRIDAIGPAADLLAEYGARARVRDWEGVLTPGRYEPDAVALLESAYWPDPREAGELGTEPLTGEALAAAALSMTDTRWGHSARRGVQRLLARGTTVLAGPFTRPAVAAAVARSGLHVAPSPPPPLRTSGTADFTVHAPDGSCLTTVLAGRLVFRRR
ncbi:imidazolonepropionase-like domain-containing protein [Streptomyces abyssomicinicus]|uniref:imidazolonepropionase-like domain-containing protein n=1 Tax=Streptomyces abyssomicinicus TaxID=574929 RepID=UPI001250CC9E|nr:hypothetical protein [Streptomyces abyssomicinicus]